MSKHKLKYINSEVKGKDPPAPDDNLAIVGSSARLLNSKHGKLIDSFTDVVRFNRAPTQGYEQHVGSKTTILVANNHVFCNQKHNGWKPHGSIPPASFIRSQRDMDIIHLGPPECWSRRRRHVHVSCCSFLANYGHIRSSLTNIVKGQPSCGFAFLWICLESGLKPSIFGYGIGEENYGQYYDKNAISSHEMKSERTKIKEWIEEGLVEFYE